VTGTTQPSPAPTNPRWVRITVIALIVLVWVAAVIAIVRGESWVEAGFTALISTFCLSAVDLGIDLSRRRKS
jgi:hypothetical protein